MTKLALVLLVACAASQPVAPAQPVAPITWIAETSTYAQNTSQHDAIADRYRGAAEKILTAARDDRGAYQKLAELTDTIGHRLAGSPELDRAIVWAVATMKADGFAVHTEKVMVPHWVRGIEEAAIVTPNPRAIRVLGLGMNLGTPKGGITAPIVVVHGWDELDAQKDKVKGAIVLFNVAMPTYNPRAAGFDSTGYGKTVGYRARGAAKAAAYGAVGMLMRSVTARSIATLHTGSMSYRDLPEGVAKIPAAAVTIEEAQLLDRLAHRGPVTFHLKLDDQLLPDVESANVVADFVGTDKPEEIVVIGGHLDSWDVGQGANDDGAGCVIAMQTIQLLKTLGLHPRRTIRVVLWTNEENGVRGGAAYAEAHKDELAKTVMAVESDSGGGAPTGFSAGANDPATSKRVVARVAQIATLLQPLHATRVVEAEGETDTSPMAPAGVPQVGLGVDVSTYFDYHHTDADTLDKVDPQNLANDVAAMAVLAYVVADLPGRISDPKSEP
ncbi:M28 family metallopeptidase [soil metagenome]